MYFTSYFGNIKNINMKKYKLVCITNSKPSFCDSSIEDWSFLGPTKELLKLYKNNKINEKEYTKIYLQYIDDKWTEIKDFLHQHENENIVMLCYEKSTDFCHRHLLRTYLNTKGIDCKELTKDDI